MSAIDFEYAIRKDVRNNPIVREVDAARQRQLWKTAAICGALALVVLFSVWQSFQVRMQSQAILQMEREQAEEQEINRQLRLEIEMLRSPEWIESVATRQLKLVRPTVDRAIVIERVAPSPAPDKSVVATR